ncbi:MAG: hypothetical protein ACRDLB_00305 [Actinomycetota bacterium]
MPTWPRQRCPPATSSYVAGRIALEGDRVHVVMIVVLGSVEQLARRRERQRVDTLRIFAQNEQVRLFAEVRRHVDAVGPVATYADCGDVHPRGVIDDLVVAPHERDVLLLAPVRRQLVEATFVTGREQNRRTRRPREAERDGIRVVRTHGVGVVREDDAAARRRLEEQSIPEPTPISPRAFLVGPDAADARATRGRGEQPAISGKRHLASPRHRAETATGE